MRALKICLWISGIMWLSSSAGVLLPVSTIKSFVAYMGIESFPDSALFLYGLRVALAIDAGIGIFFIILALRPMDYGIMVPFSGVGSIAVGVICAITGISVNMPTLWFLGDSLFCFVLGVLILVFWRQNK